MRPEQCLIVWCDSPLGLISTRVDEDGQPVRYTVDHVDPDVAPVVTHTRAIFDILRKKDGTKIAIPTPYVTQTLGWTI